MATRPHYYAVTTTGGGWRVVAEGDTREGTREAGHAAIGPIWTPGNVAGDIYAETEHKNLSVQSRTEMRTKFRNTLATYEWGLRGMTPDGEPLEDPIYV